MEGFSAEIGNLLGKKKDGKEQKPSGFNLDVSAGGIAKVAGLGALAGGGAMAAVDLIVKQFKPLMGMVQQISKVLLEFLRPIAEVVMYLLQPILTMVRPLLQILNAIMAPYRKAAQQLNAESRQAFSEGNETKGLLLAGAAATTILKPFQDFFITLIGEGVKIGIDVIAGFMKTVVAFFTNVIATFASFFSDDLGEKIRDIGTVTMDYIDANADIIKLGIDGAVTAIKNYSSVGLQMMVSALGSDVIIPKIANVADPASLAGLTAEAFRAYVTDVGNVINGTFDPDTQDGMVDQFRKGMKTWADEAIKAQKEAFERMNKAAKSNGGGSMNYSKNYQSTVSGGGDSTAGGYTGNSNGAGYSGYKAPSSYTPTYSSVRRVDGSG